MSLRASPTFVLPILLSLSGCGDSAEWTVDPRVGLALEHQISLLGLRVDTDHQIVAVATDASGNETAFEAIQFRTDPLPEDFPRFVLDHDVPVLVGESLVASGPRALADRLVRLHPSSSCVLPD